MADPTMTVLDDRASGLRDWLAGHTVGSLHPMDVTVDRDVDSAGDEAWYFTIVLANPVAGADTWEVDDLDQFQREARDKALELGLDWPWYLRFEPESDVEPEEPPRELDA